MKRRWKIVIGIAIGVFIAPVLARVISGWVMQSRLDAKLEEVRRAGEPLTLPEIAPPEIPASENAAVIYEQAFGLLRGMSDNESRRLTRLSDPLKPLTAEGRTEARALVSNRSQEIELLRQGAALGKCRFPVAYGARDATAIALPHLATIQPAARLLVLSSRVNLEEGRGDESVRDVRSALGLARSVRDEPILISALVGMYLNRMPLKQLESALDRSEVSADVLRQTSSTLGDIGDRSQFIRVMRGERCIGLSAFNFVLGNTGGRPGWPVIIFRPIVVADEIYYLDVMGRYVELAGRSSAEAGGAWAAQVAEVGHSGLSHFMSRMLLPSLNKAMSAWDLDAAQKGCGELALALRLHRMKHGGYPSTLAELAPEFMDKLPADPFSGKTFVYRREGNGFIVYSVGRNGKDDGGIEDPKNRDAGDIVWKCSR